MTKSSKLDLSQKWDAIVIGTGMGGATTGYALASKGFSVLFLEKGSEVAPGQALTDKEMPAERLKKGWWPNAFSQSQKDGSSEKFHASVGCGLGGSTIHYAAALERFEATDFNALGTGEQSVDAWPVTHQAFLPFYEQAEQLYNISSKNDISNKIELSEWDMRFMQTMQKNGLNPERLSVGMKYDKDCAECIGTVCHRRCKSDAKTICLDEALKNPNCHVLDFCDVHSLEADEHQVKHVIATRHGNKLKLNAKKIILSAGAMHSPQILLQSKNKFWPNGLANSSDQVGRNLMFHGLDMYAVWAPKKYNRKSIQKKSLSIRDFYLKDGIRMGYIQSLGLDAGRGHISLFLKNKLRRLGLHNEFLLSAITKIPSTVAANMLGNASIFAVNMEDDPRPNNRITLNPEEPNGASFSYTHTDDIFDRANVLRKEFSKHIKPWKLLRIVPTVEINDGHSCGTCRFGTDPTNSVLDHNCKSHDISNLYVVDSSFMPRSGSANPSLTIAANALRVAASITETLQNDNSTMPT